jgi:hypothetical protein
MFEALFKDNSFAVFLEEANTGQKHCSHLFLKGKCRKIINRSFFNKNNKKFKVKFTTLSYCSYGHKSAAIHWDLFLRITIFKVHR